MLTSRSTAWFTKECEIRSASHVRGGQECACQTNNHEEVVTGISDVVDDFIFREEASKWEHAAQCKRGDNPRAERNGHVLTQTTHVLLHVERVM